MVIFRYVNVPEGILRESPARIKKKRFEILEPPWNQKNAQEQIASSKMAENVGMVQDDVKIVKQSQNDPKTSLYFFQVQSENKSNWENTTVGMGWYGPKNAKKKTASS